MANLTEVEYLPNPENAAIYDDLYRIYIELHDMFGKGGTIVMPELKRIQKQSIVQKAALNLTEQLK